MCPYSKSSRRKRICLLSVLSMSVVCAMGSGSVLTQEVVELKVGSTGTRDTSPVFMSNAFLTDVPNDWDEL